MHLARLSRVSLAALAAIALLLAAPASAHALGFGAIVGQVEADSGTAGSTRGVFGRFNLIGPLKGEVALARISYDGQERSDRRLTLGLHVDLFSIGKFLPYVVAATGIVEVETPGWSGQLVFDELGVGVAYRLESRISIEVEYREGHIGLLEDDDPSILPVLPPVASDDDYWQLQAGVAINF